MNKHIKIFFGAMLACSPCVMAQAQEETDSVQSEKIPVAFKEVDERDLLGGVSVLDYEELTKKNFNTYSLDNMQAYINGFSGQLWGNDSYLVLVDGVPREATTVLPTDIEKITFMKSAAAVALYGRAPSSSLPRKAKRDRCASMVVSTTRSTPPSGILST